MEDEMEDGMEEQRTEDAGTAGTGDTATAMREGGGRISMTTETGTECGLSGDRCGGGRLSLPGERGGQPSVATYKLSLNPKN